MSKEPYVSAMVTEENCYLWRSILNIETSYVHSMGFDMRLSICAGEFRSHSKMNSWYTSIAASSVTGNFGDSPRSLSRYFAVNDRSEIGNERFCYKTNFRLS